MKTYGNVRILRFEDLSTSQLYDMLWIRSKIFVEEQGCPYLDLDYIDQKCLHCLLYENAVLTAYARVIPAGIQHADASIGRVVTLKQGQGYGKQIFSAAMKAAVDILGATRIEISSQAYIKHFYESFGFRVTSEEFMMEFRPHITMVWEKSKDHFLS